MPWGNVPDDWDMYWRRCDDCGKEYHLSEGGCSCHDYDEEKKWDEVLDRLSSKKCVIDFVEKETKKWPIDDEIGHPINKGDVEVRLFITEGETVDELIFTQENWEIVKKIIKYQEKESEDV